MERGSEVQARSRRLVNLVRAGAPGKVERHTCAPRIPLPSEGDEEAACELGGASNAPWSKVPFASDREVRQRLWSRWSRWCVSHGGGQQKKAKGRKHALGPSSASGAWPGDPS